MRARLFSRQSGAVLAQELGLLCNIVGTVVYFSLVGQVFAQVMIGMALALALLIALGISRKAVWIPVLGALYGALQVAWYLGNPYIRARLLDPHIITFYTVDVIILLGASVTAVAGCAAAIQRLRHQESATLPRWLTMALTGLGIVTLCALLAPLRPAAAAPSSQKPSTNQTITVHLGQDYTETSAVQVPVGGTLLLVNDGPYIHIMGNGEWVGAAAHQLNEAGAPRVANVTVSDKAVAIGPFTTPGTYHLYCIIHPGMQLTVTVMN